MKVAYQAVACLGFAGIGQVCCLELTQRGIEYQLDDIVRLRNHDLVLLKVSTDDLDKIRRLRSVEDVFIPITVAVPVRSYGDLRQSKAWWREERFFHALKLKSELFSAKKPKKTIGFAVFVKQDRDHALYRKQIAAAIAGKLGSYRRWQPRDPADVEVWGFLKDNCLTTCLRLTDHSFRQRSYRSDQRHGALRPTIAASLVAVSEPRSTDVVLDPMCGTGTILAERIGWGPFAHIYGSDADPQAVAISQRTVQSCLRSPKRVATTVAEYDARRLPLDSQSVDVIITNLPWDRRFRTGRQFYDQVLPEFRRVLSPQGRMVLLTPRYRDIESACQTLDLKVGVSFRAKVLGAWAQALFVESFHQL